MVLFVALSDFALPAQRASWDSELVPREPRTPGALPPAPSMLGLGATTVPPDLHSELKGNPAPSGSSLGGRAEVGQEQTVFPKENVG